ncbi:MAG: hypothetical protein RLY20_2633 [Verrucomicrobiota bacterium]
MEIKIQCDCGQKFKFDAEPVNGRMPWEVNCPVCGASGTDKANWVIAHAAPSPTVPVATPLSAPIAPIGSVTSAPPAAPVAQPLPNAEPPKPRLAIRQHAPAPAAAAPPQPPIPRPVPLQPVSVEEKDSPSTNALFFRGVLGAFIGALIGMGVWYGLVVATGYQIGYVAWGIGALTGFGARVLGRDGNTALGVTSAIFAAIAILGGGTLAVHHMYFTEKNELSHENIIHEIYTENVKQAKEAGPLETDAQIKAFMAKRDEVSVSEVTDEELAAFKKDDLPELKEMASGALTEQEYIKRHHTESKAVSGIATAAGWIGSFIGSLFSLWTILWLFLGCASAYKIGADAD